MSWRFLQTWPSSDTTRFAVCTTLRIGGFKRWPDSTQRPQPRTSVSLRKGNCRALWKALDHDSSGITTIEEPPIQEMDGELMGIHGGFVCRYPKPKKKKWRWKIHHLSTITIPRVKRVWEQCSWSDACGMLEDNLNPFCRCLKRFIIEVVAQLRWIRRQNNMWIA